MNLLILLTFLAIFFVTMLCVGVGLAYHESQQRKQFSQMLRTVQAGNQAPTRELLRAADQVSAASVYLEKLPWMSSLDRAVRQSGTDWTVGKVLGMCLGGGLLGALVGLKVNLLSMPAASAGVFCLAGVLTPLGLLARKQSKNISRFESQFPEALDFLARCLRAGHGFSTALELLAADAPDPLGAAVRRVANELQLGSSFNVAMQSLTEAVPLIDVRFFISAVIIQRESGGNLGEILTRLATIIRERFRLQGSVKALSAHGRITGLVLLVMPVVVLIILSVISPAYFAGLTQDKTGQMLLGGAAFGQVLAYFAIRKIVNIKV